MSSLPRMKYECYDNDISKSTTEVKNIFFLTPKALIFFV